MTPNDAPTPAAQPAAPVHKDVVSRAPAVTTQPQPPAPAKLVNKISSAKIPPPSTKIPKSAVIMPDGTSNSTSFNLDVQFGVDLDTPIHTDAKPVVPQQRAAPAVTTPIQPAQPLKPQPPLGISNQMGGVKGVLNADQSIVSVGSSGAPQENKSVDAQSLATKANQLNNSAQQSQPQTQQQQQQQQQPQAHHQTSIGAQNLKLNQENAGYNESKQKIQNFMPLNKQQQQPQPQQQSQQFNINQLKQQQQQNESNILHQSQAQQNQQQQQQPLPQRDSHHGQHHHNQPSSNSASSLQQNGQLNNSAGVKQQQQQQPQNSQSLVSNNAQLGQQQQNAIAQLQQLNQNNSSNANSNSNNQQQQQQISLSSIQNPVNAAGASVAANAKQSTMAPPPGVNMVNPNNQFLMSLPFVCYDVCFRIFVYSSLSNLIFFFFFLSFSAFLAAKLFVLWSVTNGY